VWKPASGGTQGQFWKHLEDVHQIIKPGKRKNTETTQAIHEIVKRLLIEGQCWGEAEATKEQKDALELLGIPLKDVTQASSRRRTSPTSEPPSAAASTGADLAYWIRRLDQGEGLDLGQVVAVVQVEERLDDRDDGLRVTGRPGAHRVLCQLVVSDATWYHSLHHTPLDPSEADQGWRAAGEACCRSSWRGVSRSGTRSWVI